MRLIDADALINDILTDYGCDPKYIADETIDGLKPYTDQLILERIGLQPTVPSSPWHRVEEELPESGEFGKIVLACDDVGTVNAAYLSSDGEWYAADNAVWDAWAWMPNVTHWMPLPEPPKEDA